MPAAHPGSEKNPSSVPARTRWGDAGLLAVGAVGLLVALEWLFFVTKPSMFSVMSWPQKVAVGLAALLPAMLAAALAALLVSAVGRAWPARRGGRAVAGVAGAAVPAALLAATALLLVENFTRTVFGFSLASFRSPLRYVYAAGFLLLFALLVRRLWRLAGGRAFRSRRRAAVAGAAVVAVLAAAASAMRYDPGRRADRLDLAADRRLPNVLLLSSDGVDADRMSVYGSPRKTTPFLESRIDELVVSENHLTNASTTAGSTGALLTGKLPTTTGVSQQFHVFQGRDVYEHLPGVLRQLGYYGIEIGERHYADSHDQNLRQGFHVSNSRALTAGVLPLERYGRLFPSERYFLGSTVERIRERLAHAFGLADMPEPLLALTEQQPAWTSDTLRITALEREIARAPRPFFAHVHLLDTHGPRFRFPRQHFSSGVQTADWERDFLDDAILGFDGYVERVVRFLEDRGELDDTLLVVNSDHGARWSTSVRLPLVIRFPEARPRGSIVPNTQRIDVAPTILSYLGVEPPDWMEGQSILDPGIDPLRLVFATGWRDNPTDSSLSVIQCQRWYWLNPDSGAIDERTLAGHTEPCPESRLAGAEGARRVLVAQLDASRHFVPPLALGAKLSQLKLRDDPAERRRLAEAILDGRTQTRWLDDEMAAARLHWDLWTYGTSPAALVVVNRGDAPLVRQLEVRSAGEREFPVAFHLDDGRRTQDFVFERPGAITVELAPVPPGSERLFIVWSDRDFRVGRRRLGVKLAASFGDTLAKLARRPDAELRRQLAQDILGGATPSRRLGEDLLIAGAHWDHWTRGRQPAALVVRNPADEPAVRRLAVRSGDGREFPVRVWLEDGATRREVVFERPGEQMVELPAIPPGGERLIVVWTDRSWVPGSRDPRILGVQLAPAS